MKKEKIKQLIQFILARVFVILFVVFVVKMPMVDVILSYRWLFLILSISYFYYYSIEYDIEKKYESIRKMIIYWNVYLLAFVFFRPLLNISWVLFIVLWLVILGLCGTIKMVSRWKKLLQIFWWLISFLILISGMFYLYPDAPDIDWFLRWKNVEFLVEWVQNKVEKFDAYLQIITPNKIEDFTINEISKKKLTENVSILYRSLRYDRDEMVFLVSKNWDIVQIFPQTEIELLFSWENLSFINVNNWKIWFLSGVLNSSLKYEWQSVILDEKSLDFLQIFQDNYRSDLVLYLENQISDWNVSVVNNTIMRNIDWKLLAILAKFFPVSYWDNLKNYKEFQKYFALSNEKIELWTFSKNLNSNPTNSLWKGLVNNMKIWKWNIYTRKTKDLKN